MEWLKRLPVAIRLLIVLGPSLLLLGLFLGFIAQADHFGKLGREGTGQLTGLPAGPVGFVVISAGIDREMAALAAMKQWDYQFLFIGGVEPGFDLGKAIAEVFPSPADQQRVAAKTLWDQAPPTTLAVAQAGIAQFRTRGISTMYVVINDVWMPRTLEQFRVMAGKDMTILPYSSPCHLTPFRMSGQNTAIYWWEFCKYMIWRTLAVAKSSF